MKRFKAFNLRGGIPIIICIDEISSVEVSTTSKDYTVIKMNNSDRFEIDFSIDRFVEILTVREYEKKSE